MIRRSPGVSSGIFSRNHLSPLSFEPRFYFEADDGKNPTGGDNTNGDNADNGNSSGVNQNSGGQSVKDAVRAAMAELVKDTGGDKDEALAIMIRKNHTLEQRATTAESNQLKKTDRELLNNFKALNLSLDDVKKIVSEHSQFTQERERAAKVDSLKKAAQAAGLNGDLLASLEGALDAEYSIVGEGENAKVLVKVTNGDTKTDKPLDDWIAEKWPALTETLKATAGASTGTQNGTQTQTVTRYGQSAPAQAGQQASSFDAIRAEKKKQKEAAASGATGWTKELGLPE